MSRLSPFPTLTRQEDFDRIYRRADKVWHTPSFVLFFKANPSRGVAFVAGKKVGKAVQRNRAKRRLRALFSDSQNSLINGYYILVAKPSILEVSHARLQNDWKFALKRSGALRKGSSLQ